MDIIEKLYAYLLTPRNYKGLALIKAHLLLLGFSDIMIDVQTDSLYAESLHLAHIRCPAVNSARFLFLPDQIIQIGTTIFKIID